MVAFETQPNTPANYSATGVRVFGWKLSAENLTEYSMEVIFTV